MSLSSLSTVGTRMLSNITPTCKSETVTICSPNKWWKGFYIIFSLTFIALMITSLQMITKGKPWKKWIYIMGISQCLFLLLSLIYIYAFKKILSPLSFMAILLGMCAIFISSYIVIMFIKTNSYPDLRPYFYVSIVISFFLFAM